MNKKRFIKVIVLSLIALFPSYSILAIEKVSCGNVTAIPKKIPELTSDIITILQIAVPIILIVMGSIDFFKSVVAGKEDEMKKNQKMFVKRLITSALIFFIVVIVKFMISVIADTTSAENIVECIDCFISGPSKCREYIEPVKSKEDETITPPVYVPDSSSNSSTNKKPTTNSSTNKNPSSSSNSSTNKTPTTTPSTNIKANKNIFVGDSRTVQMCAAKTGDWTNCPYDSGGEKISNNDIYIAQVGKSYKWFNETAVPKVNSRISTGKDKYNIILLMGVNDGVSSSKNGKKAANKYYKKVSELAKTKWKNHNVIYVSVNPVRETKNHYAKVSGVDAFNKEMKSKINSSKISNLKYCDTASSISASQKNSSDGLHYNNDTNKKVYDIIVNNCLK